MFVYSFSVNGSQVIAKLNVQSAQMFAPIEFEGGKNAVKAVKAWLGTEHGAFGHFLNINSASALDLELATKSPKAAQFIPKRIAGGELLENAGSGVPPGVMT